MLGARFSTTPGGLAGVLALGLAVIFGGVFPFFAGGRGGGVFLGVVVVVVGVDTMFRMDPADIKKFDTVPVFERGCLSVRHNRLFLSERYNRYSCKFE